MGINIIMLGDLISRVHIEGAQVHAPSDLNSVLDSGMDYSDFNKEIALQAKATRAYLSANLEMSA